MSTFLLPVFTTFKRLAVGDRFTTPMGKFRKVSKRGAYAIAANGRGKTNAEVGFTRSATVAAVR